MRGTIIFIDYFIYGASWQKFLLQNGQPRIPFLGKIVGQKLGNWKSLGKKFKSDTINNCIPELRSAFVVKAKTEFLKRPLGLKFSNIFLSKFCRTTPTFFTLSREVLSYLLKKFIFLHLQWQGEANIFLLSIPLIN